MQKLLLFLLCFSFSIGINAQKAISLGKFKITKFRISTGEDNDMINNMNYTYFVNQIGQNQDFPFRNEEFPSANFHSGVCENPNFSIGLTLTHPKLKNFEWRNTFNIMKNRNDAVNYYDPRANNGEYISFYGSHNEFGLESALLYQLKVLPFLNLYGGVGTNIGLTTNNSICYSAYFNMDENEIDTRSDSDMFGCYDTGTMVNQRLFYELGVGVELFKRVELGFNVRNGIGYRAGNGHTVGTRLQSANLSLSYILR